MANQFSRVMSKRTDAELMKIVTIDRSGYQPLALEAAEEEVRRRGIDESAIEKAKIVVAARLEKEKEEDAGKANTGTRFANHLIDSILVFVVFLACLFIMISLLPLEREASGTFIVYFLYLAVNFTYYIYMEYNHQKTVGKILTKSKVVTTAGGKPTLADITKRTACRFIPFDPLTFVFGDNGVHDTVSDTKVIMDDDVMGN